MDTLKLLQQLMLFETFSDAQLTWLVEQARESTCGAGKQVFTEGQPAEALWVRIDGKWHITRIVGDTQFLVRLPIHGT